MRGEEVIEVIGRVVMDQRGRESQINYVYYYKFFVVCVYRLINTS